MAALDAFKSAGQASVALTTASVATATTIPGDGDSILIFNNTAVPVACDFSVNTLTATANSPYVVPPGLRMIVRATRGVPLYAAAFPIGTASASVYFMRGEGSLY